METNGETDTQMNLRAVGDTHPDKPFCTYVDMMSELRSFTQGQKAFVRILRSVCVFKPLHEKQLLKQFCFIAARRQIIILCAKRKRKSGNRKPSIIITQFKKEQDKLDDDSPAELLRIFSDCVLFSTFKTRFKGISGWKIE